VTLRGFFKETAAFRSACYTVAQRVTLIAIMPDDPPKDGAMHAASEPVSATPPPVPSGEAQAKDALHGDPLVGKVLLDRVRIIRAIARGGMGKVYLGEQTRMKRQCAVKVLDPKLTAIGDAGEFARRFLLEASIAAKLTHPHVVTIFDYGETPDGCFIAMEYLAGRSVSEELKKDARFVPARAIHIAKQVARALREAHALGVVHRDVKPGNIFLLRQDDDDDFVKVLDFGLVHDSKAGDGHAPTDTIMGSPRYMAPEQVQGKEVDPRTDIYSLGAVLYAMLTGHPPFERRTDLATMMAQVSDPPPAMSSVVPGLVVPPQLEAIVMRCLAKNPDARWASMEDLVTALSGCSASVPVGPQMLGGAPAGTPSPRPRPSKRSSGRAGTFAVAALFAVVTVLVGIALLDRPAPAPAPVTAVAPPVASSTVPVATAPPKPTASATLHVESDPPGAKVKEEGETMCPSTPCDIVYTGQAADPSVEHMLAFHLPGYKLERKVTSATASAVTVKLIKAR
jgi:serine/threonine-protein kinase